MTLLIIADDFTGALDTGVQFSAAGAVTRVVTRTDYDLSLLDPAVQVLVMDAETRHLAPEEAYQVVRDLSQRAADMGVPYIYKKTDSALRGNVGAELAALLDAAGEQQLSFLPQLPQMNRVTVKGVHYIDGQPVEESAFGKDPFNPVTCSYIPDILKGQWDVEVTTASPEQDAAPREPGIVVWDGTTMEDLERVGSLLAKEKKLHLLAGCAGFAQILPGLLGLEGVRHEVPRLDPSFLVICGSVHPATKAQMDFGETRGFTRIRLTPEQKLNRGYWEGPEGSAFLERLAELCRTRSRCIVETNDLPGSSATMEYAGREGMNLEQVRSAIPKALARIVRDLWQSGITNTILVTGGDTLMACMDMMGVWEMEPVCEMAAGTVLAAFRLGDSIRYMMTKSGGFGKPELLAALAEQLENQ